ncbi:hypothetical protein PLUTE_a5007 [Pseudoalteromonas luteoviolacea DSM 6061]|nr:hypothetical protein [Pseudoalteromonas luteoviolacea DSM 6061]
MYQGGPYGKNCYRIVDSFFFTLYAASRCTIYSSYRGIFSNAFIRWLHWL